jgi:hypothetical protein
MFKVIINGIPYEASDNDIIIIMDESHKKAIESIESGKYVSYSPDYKDKELAKKQARSELDLPSCLNC